MDLKNITFKHVLTFIEIIKDEGEKDRYRIDFLIESKEPPSKLPGVYVVEEGGNILYIGSYKRGVIKRWVKTRKRDIYHFKKANIERELKEGKIVKVFYQDEDVIKKELGYSNNPWISSHSIEDNLLEQCGTKWNKRGSNKKQNQ